MSQFKRDYTKAVAALENLNREIARTPLNESDDHETLAQVLSLMKHDLFKNIVDVQEDYCQSLSTVNQRREASRVDLERERPSLRRSFKHRFGIKDGKQNKASNSANDTATQSSSNQITNHDVSMNRYEEIQTTGAMKELPKSPTIESYGQHEYEDIVVEPAVAVPTVNKNRPSPVTTPISTQSGKAATDRPSSIGFNRPPSYEHTNAARSPSRSPVRSPVRSPPTSPTTSIPISTEKAPEIISQRSSVPINAKNIAPPNDFKDKPLSSTIGPENSRQAQRISQQMERHSNVQTQQSQNLQGNRSPTAKSFPTVNKEYDIPATNAKNLQGDQRDNQLSMHANVSQFPQRPQYDHHEAAPGPRMSHYAQSNVRPMAEKAYYDIPQAQQVRNTRPQTHIRPIEGQPVHRPTGIRQQRPQQNYNISPGNRSAGIRQQNQPGIKQAPSANHSMGMRQPISQGRGQPNQGNVPVQRPRMPQQNYQPRSRPAHPGAESYRQHPPGQVRATGTAPPGYRPRSEQYNQTATRPVRYPDAQRPQDVNHRYARPPFATRPSAQSGIQPIRPVGRGVSENMVATRVGQQMAPINNRFNQQQFSEQKLNNARPNGIDTAVMQQNVDRPQEQQSNSRIVNESAAAGKVTGSIVMHPKSLKKPGSSNSMGPVNEDGDRIIEMVKPVKGFGLSLLGASEFGVYVAKLNGGGAAEIDGRFKKGDQIIEVNGFKIDGMSYSDAAQIFREIGVGTKATFLVRYNPKGLEDFERYREQKRSGTVGPN